MRAILAVAVVFLLAPSFGCADDLASTRVLVVFDADASLRARWTSLRIDVRDSDGNQIRQVDATRSGDGQFAHRIRLTPRDGDAARTYSVIGELFEGETLLARIDVHSAGFVENEARVIRLRFDASCEGVSCPLSETCAAGACSGGCFIPQPESDESLSVGSFCPFYVDGDSGNDDSEACVDPETPCETIGFARDYFRKGSGRTMFVRGQTDAGVRISYQAFTLRDDRSGAEGDPSSVVAWPGTGMPIVNAAGVDNAVELGGGSSAPRHVLIAGLELTGASDDGVWIQGSGRDLTIRDCFIHDNGGGAVEVVNADGVVLEGNRMISNGFSPPSAEADGFGVSVRNDASEVDLIGNTICGSGENAVSIQSEDVRAVRVIHNTIVRSMNNGIGIVRGPTDVTVRDNIIAFNASVGLTVQDGTMLPDSSFNLYFGNASGSRNRGEGAAMGDLREEELGDGADPGFVDLDNCDLTIAVDSSARGAASDEADIGAP